MNIRHTLSILLILSCGQFASAQKPDEEMSMMLRSIGWVAKDAALRAELDISDVQAAELQRAAKGVREQYGKMWRERGEEMRELGRLKEEGKTEEVAKRWEAIQAEMREQAKVHYDVIHETLLPHQVSRMQQITLQQSLKRKNPYGDELGAPIALADRLGLSEEEKEKLKEAIEKAREAFYKQVRELKKIATDDIMASLPVEKQKQLQEIMGDTYDPEEARKELAGKWQSFSKSRSKSKAQLEERAKAKD